MSGLRRVLETRPEFLATAVPPVIRISSPIFDSDPEEYIRLGLTPHHSVEVTTLSGETVTDKRVLHGRFLHITDLHPDELCKIGGAFVNQCHKADKKAKSDEKMHRFGDAMSGCDSSLDLYKHTLAWIRENLKDKIDFVVWTGDNVRHDNDRKYPRFEKEILDMNEKVAKRMSETFLDDGEETIYPLDRRVKIIPSLGNNDVYPHNLFAPGPTLQTREMYKIWRNFVPTEQLHTFDRGAYFFREVIPNELAVVSINTLYLFKSNPLCDNCYNRKQPGYKLFEWLGVVLKELRKRKMKVWLTGHVPPVPKNLHYSCHAKMSVWQHEYRDIIIGSLYGHMNIDHFVPLDSVKSWRMLEKKLGPREQLGYKTYDDDEDIDDMDIYEQFDLLDDDFDVLRASQRYEGATSGKVTYLETVRDTLYAKLKGPKKYGRHGERYSFAHVSASIVPTFNPGFRVWEYNVTELQKKEVETFQPWDDFFADLELELQENDIAAEQVESAAVPRKDKTLPPIMPDTAALGPAYTPQLFSPERYTQYFLDLEEAAKDEEWVFDFKPQYSTDSKPYNMESLLVADWIKLARKLAKSKPVDKSDVDTESAAKLWDTYLNRAFIKTHYEDLPFARD
ncbi:hypothetical protein OGAPHI_001418 [Ogataea philodendri]|uniref:Endopolyphosphatase n=1 Tax=Ogataea philodendri TaxID=1378263 RepID=A0A9P8PDH6_9ASCO|nr:uncharacterized protein OGAPHI_001418 [Ogataea philodendri]KAH3669297.1 hypothetical protein OGAPHI_001418 [Ogataea philodendri]